MDRGQPSRPSQRQQWADLIRRGREDKRSQSTNLVKGALVALLGPLEYRQYGITRSRPRVMGTSWWFGGPRLDSALMRRGT
ncbi:hypothetical protein HKX48_002840 [Thoreauomyces humboldtii]|nr:hypothetical protein HKX48_002840 [Thoreauomyces humboldtii]